MEARTSSFPSRSGVVSRPPPLPPYFHFLVDHRAVNNPNIPLSFRFPPYLVVDPSAPPPPPPPPYGVLVPCNFPIPSPVNPALFIKMDEQRSMSLLQYMADEGLIPSPEEEERRTNAIHELKQVVSSWIKNVAWQRRLPKHQIARTSATILTYGSYGLGVHSAESDIDALCVVPYFASIAEDFFVILHDMLKQRPEISEIHCVKSAKVPLMRFKFDGISFDVPYARLKLLYVPEDVDILNPFFTKNIDDTSWKSLSGVRANKRILQLVPNVENFQSMLRCLKLWAKRRGVYGTLFGYLGGVHIAVLAAYLCQRHPNASLSSLIMNFFRTFASWPWPAPVVLEEGMFLDAVETWPLMPIQLPSSPYQYCHSNITNSTFCRIRAEFIRGHNMTRDFVRPDFNWASIFEPFPYTRRYSRFFKIYLTTHDKDELGDWVGWIKSRFRILLVMLEDVHGFCDPNATEYVDAEKTEPNIVFYWGLQQGKSNSAGIDLVKKEFMKNISNGYDGSPGSMDVSIVQASHLPKSAQSDDNESVKVTKSCWKVVDSDKKRSPDYSPHHPHCLVGQVETNSEAECLSSGR